MKKTISALLALVAILLAVFSFASCKSGKSEKINVKNKDELIEYLKSHSGAKIAVPNDTTNEARALLLLEANGIIKLKEGAGLTATKLDIAENPYGVEIQEVEAAQLPRVLPDVAFAVINSNFAMEAKLNPVKDSLFTEPKESPYANIVAVRKGDEKRPEIQKLMKALQSPEVKKFIEERYKGAVVPAF